jgi:hypothetical protein
MHPTAEHEALHGEETQFELGCVVEDMTPRRASRQESSSVEPKAQQRLKVNSFTSAYLSN